MEISLYLDWGSFLVGLGSGMLAFFVIGMVLAYKQGRKEQQKAAEAESSQKKK